MHLAKKMHLFALFLNLYTIFGQGSGNFAPSKEKIVMSARQYNKYLWLVDTIHAAGRITLPEIERRWAAASINEKHETRLPRSTFNKIREEIGELCHIEIGCDRTTNEYYIKDLENLNKQLGKFTHFGISQQNTFKVEHPLAIQRVVLDTIPEAAEDLRRFPLDLSQREAPSTGKPFCSFEYLLSPTLEFYMKIRSLGTDVEVLEPEWLREMLSKDIEILYNTYVTRTTSIRDEANNDEENITK